MKLVQLSGREYGYEYHSSPTVYNAEGLVQSRIIVVIIIRRRR